MSAMKLTRVTITGAADDTDVGHMLGLSAEFPFVEWGILLSASQEGTERFPSRRWMDTFVVAAHEQRGVHISGHLCGQLVRDLLLGALDWRELPSIIHVARRLQINTHGEKSPWNSALFANLAPRSFTGTEIIFQWDGVNNHLAYACYGARLKVSALFDLSAGAGILPDSWLEPEPAFPCGYAGGLSPDNVVDELHRIARVCDQPFWIDMERRVRSDDDSVLDMSRVRRVLEACAPHIDVEAS